MNPNWVGSKKGTFGGSRAADVLDSMLMERDDPKLYRAIGSIVSEWHSLQRHINAIVDVDFRKWVRSKCVQHIRERVVGRKFETDVASHLINYLMTLNKKSVLALKDMPKNQVADRIRKFGEGA